MPSFSVLNNEGEGEEKERRQEEKTWQLQSLERGYLRVRKHESTPGREHTRWIRAVNVYQENIEVLFSLHNAYLGKKHTAFVFRTFICALTVTILKINVSVGNWRKSDTTHQSKAAIYPLDNTGLHYTVLYFKTLTE